MMLETKDYFTKQEADAKIDRRVRATVAIKKIPPSTTGRVVRIELLLTYGHCVVVEWDLLPNPQLDRSVWPYEDWFNKTMYKEYLSEILI